MMKRSALVLTAAAALGVILATAPSAQAAPVNDSLADAIDLSGNCGILTGVDGTGAALEDGEPDCVYTPSPKCEVNSDAAVPFTLKIEKLEAGKPVALVTHVCAESSINTTGVIEIKATLWRRSATAACPWNAWHCSGSL